MIGFKRESYYPDWLVNPVLVLKPNKKWRTCIDFMNLDKACLKDSFPLPRIDRLVDAMGGHELLSFMDAYSGYNWMHTRDTTRSQYTSTTKNTPSSSQIVALLL